MIRNYAFYVFVKWFDYNAILIGCRAPFNNNGPLDRPGICASCYMFSHQIFAQKTNLAMKISKKKQLFFLNKKFLVGIVWHWFQKIRISRSQEKPKSTWVKSHTEKGFMGVFNQTVFFGFCIVVSFGVFL